MLFPAIPAELSKLTDDELAKLAADVRAAIAAVHAAPTDPDVVGELDAQAVLAAMSDAVDGLARIDAERGERDAAIAETQAALDALAERAGIVAEAPDDGDGEPEPDGDVDGEPEGDEPVAESDEPVAEQPEVEQPVAVAASAAKRAARLPSRPSSRTPRSDESSNTAGRVAITAAADLPGYSAGQAMPDDRLAIAKALGDKHRSFGRSAPGVQVRATVASIAWQRGDDRTLDRNSDVIGLTSKARDERTAIIASGGICAPRTPLYDIDTLGVTDRPVRDALPDFTAERGGITWQVPPTVADISDAIGVMTPEDDATGGTTALKSCQSFECLDPDEADIYAIYNCVTFGNFNARTYPEMIAAYQDLALVAQAALAERALLDAIDLGSTQVTASSPPAGATTSLLGEVILAAVAYRSRNRMRQSDVLRALFPEWVKELLNVDTLRMQYPDKTGDRYSLLPIEAILRSHGIAASFYMDTPTGAGQVFGAQGAGALVVWPPIVQWYLFPEGTWVFLDGGTLDLGIVRDSTLNATNDFTVFVETFEGIAKVGGHQSLNIASTIHPSGAVGDNHLITIAAGTV